ncbi:hypothetical protein [Georgenia thermotolerans]|uniref:Uncharacterized protein n=1 Tax=Georgenia thermotolerans TaxID=527326 RepID=A0A7J5URD3_9MICO|nr:hypothetical protein [Georgenia thermotolerans]KAE8764433.1 hypothetical protein GB883_09150 [Georgenia thermotolerans]
MTEKDEKRKPGAADLTFGGADEEPALEDDLGRSPNVHGDEGGGDPAAGAYQDTHEGNRGRTKRLEP